MVLIRDNDNNIIMHVLEYYSVGKRERPPQGMHTNTHPRLVAWHDAFELEVESDND